MGVWFGPEFNTKNEVINTFLKNLVEYKKYTICYLCQVKLHPLQEGCRI